MIPTVVRQGLRRAGVRRERVMTVRARVERGLIPVLPRRSATRTGGRILCYHSVGSEHWGYNDVSPARFREQMELAAGAGYRFVDAGVIARGGGGSRDLAVTFDDGARSVLDQAAPILADRGIPWTVFVVSEWAGGRHPFHPDAFLGWQQLRELAVAGATIGSHSVSHPRFAWLGPDAAWHELHDSRAVIEDELGRPVDTFAIPFGTSRDWSPPVAALAEEAGYRAVYAQSEDRRPADTVPRTFVTGYDDRRTFLAALAGAFDQWEEWV